MQQTQRKLEEENRKMRWLACKGIPQIHLFQKFSQLLEVFQKVQDVKPCWRRCFIVDRICVFKKMCHAQLFFPGSYLKVKMYLICNFSTVSTTCLCSVIMISNSVKLNPNLNDYFIYFAQSCFFQINRKVTKTRDVIKYGIYLLNI